MSPKKINEHRNIYPLPFDQITAFSSFAQLLGKVPSDYTPKERFERFQRNLELLRKEGEEGLFRYWSKTSSNETCHGCINRDIDRNWCKAYGLPCNYNPVTGALGMACCGLGYQGQQELDFDNN